MVVRDDTLPSSRIRTVKSLWIRVQSIPASTDISVKITHIVPVEIHSTLTAVQFDTFAEWAHILTVPLIKFWPMPGSL